MRDVTPLGFVCRLVLVASLAGLWSCSDDSEMGHPWEFDDSFEARWEPLEGLPGEDYRYLGRIGDRPVFRVYGRFQPTVIVASYSARDGWVEEQELSGVMGDALRASAGPRPLIESAADAHFVVDKDAPQLHRSTDDGQTWAALDTLPTDRRIISFGADGESLFVVAPISDDAFPDRKLWRSGDAGESWVEVEHEGELQYMEVVEGLVATEQVYSTDAGRNWREFDASCPIVGNRRDFFELDAQLYYLESHQFFRLDPGSGCTALDITGLQRDDGEEDYLAEIHRVGEEIWAMTGHNRLGRIDLEAMQWEEVELPERVDTSGMDTARPYLHPLSDGEMALRTAHGLWRTSDGQSGRDVSHDFSDPYWIVEYEGDLLAWGDGGIYRRAPEGDEWRLAIADDGRSSRLIVRRGTLLRTPEQLASLERLAADGSGFERLWQDDNMYSTGIISVGRPRADVRHVEGRVFLASAGNNSRVHLPDGSNARQARDDVRYGGGMHVADSLGDEFSSFGEGLPTLHLNAPASLQSMAVYEGDIWAVTSVYGVWRLSLEDAQWTEAHGGLPRSAIGSNEEDLEVLPVREVKVLGDKLYAYGRGDIFVREDDAWRKLTSDAFAEDVEAHWHSTGLIDLVRYEDTLLAGATNGVFTVDPESGEHALFWRPQGAALLTLDALPSGLYAGLEGRGVWRYVPGFD